MLLKRLKNASLPSLHKSLQKRMTSQTEYFTLNPGELHGKLNFHSLLPLGGRYNLVALTKRSEWALMKTPGQTDRGWPRATGRAPGTRHRSRMPSPRGSASRVFERGRCHQRGVDMPQITPLPDCEKF